MSQDPIFLPVSGSPVTEVVSPFFDILPDLKKYPDFISPSYGTPFSAALDIFAQEDFNITSVTQLIDMGFKCEYPKDYALLLLPRSGLGSKFGVELANTIGLIDVDYRGTLMAALHLSGHGTKAKEIELLNNLLEDEEDYPDNCDSSTKAIRVRRGEAFAQLLLVKTDRPTPRIVSELSETVRGEGGFGSTTK